MPNEPGRPDGDLADKLTTGLGWFSLGLGVTQLAAPGLLNRAIGVRDDASSRLWQRVVGVQEISAAAGILGPGPVTPWLWGRTSGDVLHLAMLGRAYRNRLESPARLAGAIASVVGCLVADAYASARKTSDRQQTQEDHPMDGSASITILGSQDEVAERWRNFARSAGSDSRLGPIEIQSNGASDRVEWRTSDVANAKASGTTRFAGAPGDRGTEIHIHVQFDVPGGPVGAAVKKVVGDEPLQLVRDDLRRLKQLVEAGEIARSDGAPTGSSAKAQPKQRPAQPLEHADT